MPESQSDNLALTGLTAAIVSAYVGNNSLPVVELPALIADVHAAIARIQGGIPEAAPVAESLRPAVPIKKSVTNDYIICLEDGKKFKSLKRHLHTHGNMSADEYRAKWGLPADYPMVAPSYTETRSSLAKQIGLGRLRPKRK